MGSRALTWVRHTVWADYPLDPAAGPPAEGGAYPLDWRRLSPRQADREYVPRARGDGRTYQNPVSVALYALARHAESVHEGDGDALEAFLVQATTLRTSQDGAGGWRYPIAIRRYGIGPGWYSGMAQGLATSVLLRAAAVTGDARFNDAAGRAVRLMTRPVADGGCARLDAAGRRFIEEVPSTPPSMILNRALFALIGWIELDRASATPAVERLMDLLPAYDNGHWSRYDLRHGASASYAYHLLHVSLLEAIGALTGYAVLFDVADRWRRYAHDPRARARAAVEKAAFALWRLRR